METIRYNGVEVQVWTSEIDGKTCVQVDTVDTSERADGSPDIRIFLNDAFAPVYGTYDEDDQ